MIVHPDYVRIRSEWLMGHRWKGILPENFLAVEPQAAFEIVLPENEPYVKCDSQSRTLYTEQIPEDIPDLPSIHNLRFTVHALNPFTQSSDGAEIVQTTTIPLKLTFVDYNLYRVPRKTANDWDSENAELYNQVQEVVASLGNGDNYPKMYQEAISAIKKTLGVPAKGYTVILKKTEGDFLKERFLPKRLRTPQKGYYLTVPYIGASDVQTGIAHTSRSFNHFSAVQDGELEVNLSATSSKTLPQLDSLPPSLDGYLFYCLEEPITGCMWPNWPAIDKNSVGSPVVVCDMTGNLLTRPVPWEHYDIVYGVVDKLVSNSGKFGILVVKEELLREKGEGKSPEWSIQSPIGWDYHADTLDRLPGQVLRRIIVACNEVQNEITRVGKNRYQLVKELISDPFYEYLEDSDYYQCYIEDPDLRSPFNIAFDLKGIQAKLPTEAVKNRRLKLIKELSKSGFAGIAVRISKKDGPRVLTVLANIDAEEEAESYEEPIHEHYLIPAFHITGYDVSKKTKERIQNLTNFLQDFLEENPD
eukprot:CAMPEP_0115040946 /NCGR_PEP_ID=MMETSP0216-20121206/45219_1 /TAXON_ID=223996 /ORGANISM="Protocruzia adherens, Strain Boccale" /LENGTH=529 /DNA_ID=CAMNT_0002422459 /DNA_START=424 /DNA_END=2013 /DNA_ORIENTATION=-